MIDLSQSPEKALLVAVDTGTEDTDSLLDELEALASTAGAEVVARMTQRKEKPDAATFVGTGRLQEIKDFCEGNEIDLLIFDDELSPTQLRNIENETDVRTIDRTILILDIFAANARSDEGRIQVDLARYQYMLPRLSGQGLGLSRQGGIGMRRGAGESKLETDKRHIRRQIQSLKQKLEEIEKRREQQRRRRKKQGIVSVALVGYTNAGKSTLLNLLTDAGVLAEDKLFATLDPTARKLTLKNGQDVILIDTVGLIRKLPHHLISAFESTLETATDADLILNICDASSEDVEEHIRVTKQILKDLGAADKPMITVYNKCDLLPDTLPLEKGSVAISAVTGDGIDDLLKGIENALPKTRQRFVFDIPFEKGQIANEIRKTAVVHSENYHRTGLRMDCTVSISDAEKYKAFMVKD